MDYLICWAITTSVFVWHYMTNPHVTKDEIGIATVTAFALGGLWPCVWALGFMWLLMRGAETVFSVVRKK